MESPQWAVTALASVVIGAALLITNAPTTHHHVKRIDIRAPVHSVTMMQTQDMRTIATQPHKYPLPALSVNSEPPNSLPEDQQFPFHMITLPMFSIVTVLLGGVGLWVKSKGQAPPAGTTTAISVDLISVGYGSHHSVAMAATTGESQWSIGHVDPNEPGYRVMAKAEIPGVLPRDDLMDQLRKWAVIQFQDDGKSNFGVTMQVIAQPDAEGQSLSFLICIPLSNGASTLEIQACLDSEEFIVQRQRDGFGKEVEEVENTGKASFTVKGRNFLLRRREGPLPDDMRPLLLNVLQGLCQSVNNYYAFGSVFASDAT